MIYVLNLVVSLASAGFGGIALFNPAALSRSPEVTDGERFYERLYSARALTWELLAGVLPYYAQGPVVAAVLAASAAVQLADAAIGIGRRDASLVAGATFAAGVHALCSWRAL